MKRKAGYVPERGDAVWITLDPQAGHEQAGRRPALVVSPAGYNGRVGLALMCPITNQLPRDGNRSRKHHDARPRSRPIRLVDAEPVAQLVS